MTLLVLLGSVALRSRYGLMLVPIEEVVSIGAAVVKGWASAFPARQSTASIMLRHRRFKRRNSVVVGARPAPRPRQPPADVAAHHNAVRHARAKWISSNFAED